MSQTTGSGPCFTVTSIGQMTVPKRLLTKIQPTPQKGRFCSIAWNPSLEKILAKRYGRRGLCLKVFRPLRYDQMPEEYEWQRVPILEATTIQNRCAAHGLAPPVLDVVVLNGKRIAQVTVLIRPKGAKRVKKLHRFFRKHKIGRYGSRVDTMESSGSWVGDQFIDFGKVHWEVHSMAKKQLVKAIDIHTDLLAQVPTTPEHKHYGTHCYIAKSDELGAILEKEYGRSGLCLKVFSKSPTQDELKDPASFRWQHTGLVEATQIQNLFAWAGISPRVYGLVLINGLRFAQVTDYVLPDSGKDQKTKAAKLCAQFKLGVKKTRFPDKQGAFEYVNDSNKWLGKWFIDFGRFYFRKPQVYVQFISDQIKKYPLGANRSKKMSYQDQPWLDLPGRRDMAYRAKQMRLQDCKLKGKTLLDVGCNAGGFVRIAMDLGAVRAVGVDHKYAEASYHISNWLGYWNCDFYHLELPSERGQIVKRSGIKKFDVVLFLSVTDTKGTKRLGWIAQWWADLCGPSGIMYVEGHHGDSKDKYQTALQKLFAEVEWLGYLKDNGRRILFRCWVKKWATPRSKKAKREDAVRRGQSIRGRAKTRREEAYFLWDLADQAPDGTAVEAGILNGASLLVWARARVDRGQVYAIDYKNRAVMRANIKRSGLDIKVLIGNSWERIKDVPGLLAFAFIDAGHTEDRFPKDLAAYAPRIMPGGIICFHDYKTYPERGFVIGKHVDKWAEAEGWELIGRAGSIIAFRKPYPEVTDGILRARPEGGSETTARRARPPSKTGTGTAETRESQEEA